jgi:hypothetical protein
MNRKNEHKRRGGTLNKTSRRMTARRRTVHDLGPREARDNRVIGGSGPFKVFITVEALP